MRSPTPRTSRRRSRTRSSSVSGSERSLPAASSMASGSRRADRRSDRRSMPPRLRADRRRARPRCERGTAAPLRIPAGHRHRSPTPPGLERRHGVDGLTPHPERFAARGQHANACRVRHHPGQQGRDGSRHVLAVVDDQQHPGATQPGDHSVIGANAAASSRRDSTRANAPSTPSPSSAARSIHQMPSGNRDLSLARPRWRAASCPRRPGRRGKPADDVARARADSRDRAHGRSAMSPGVARHASVQQHRGRGFAPAAVSGVRETQLLASVQSERVDEHGPRLAVGGERLGPPIRAVEGQHQLCPRAFALGGLRHPCRARAPVHDGGPAPAWPPPDPPRAATGAR